MQGVENGHTAPARGSSRPSRQAAAAEDDDDDDDEIYEPPVKSLLICFDKKNYNKILEYIFYFQTASYKREKFQHTFTYFIGVYVYIMPYDIFPINVFFS